MDDLVFLNIDDCTNVQVETPNTIGDLAYLDYVSELIVPPSELITHYILQVSNNCCPPVSYNLAPSHDIVLNDIGYACGVNQGTGHDEAIVTMEITGIDVSIITNPMVSLDGGTVFTPIVFTVGSQFNITIDSGGIGAWPAAGSQQVIVSIETPAPVSFVYLLDMTISWAIDPCTDGISTGTTVTYPALPVEVVIDGAGLLDFNVLMSDNPIFSGVYQVIISEVQAAGTVSIQNDVFIECDIKCDIVGKLVQCKDSNIMFFYDALNLSNSCSNVPYTDKCAMYEMLVHKIDQADCIDPFDDCNCNGSTLMLPRGANQKTLSRDCGC